MSGEGRGLQGEEAGGLAEGEEVRREVEPWGNSQSGRAECKAGTTQEAEEVTRGWTVKPRGK